MIGLIAAMESERKSVTDRMSEVTESETASVKFYKGKIGSEEAVVALSGVGKVSAAIAATLLCQIFQPDALISIGVAGGLKNEQEVGDLVLSDLAIQADFDVSFLDGPKGIGKVFHADKALLERGTKAAEKCGLRWSVGTIATQDLFMAGDEDYARLMSRFPESAASEMEGGAIAQVATQFHLPFLIIRTLSDVVVHDDNPVEFSTFAESSSRKAAEFFEVFCSL
ncbi:5'-methylthioadenosine/adenosylhomocysteine nucleosidase [Allobaculum mucilyticum]|uniref:5'-methylthioadenosine/adenosylhomocysteine nucleosidase n=1 Tax=Allobaculum mucilyticum TaxID=2834459 RepID=UPI001E5FC7CE|nr:5'-methylthioadenosine/adenosylhomocysteine nucleosidase [Allobaculum mucilyticum]UNT95229.1 5'-methylthioadenosine/adenosylhomocysteine nucleosidase [Allobaculum mucilyticum]